MTLICLLIAWGMSISAFAAIIAGCTSGFRNLRRLHNIPCSNCQYFTNSNYLKCTVNPDLACSENAIDCRDFSPLSANNPPKCHRDKSFIHTL
jgi:hypothetical protein